MLAFTTDRYRPAERLDAFNEEFARRVMLLDRVWLEGNRQFHGEIELRHIGPLAYAQLVSSPVHFERRQRVHNDEAVMLSVHTRGRFQLQRGDMAWDSRDDFAALMTDTDPVRGYFDGEAINMWIPQGLLAPHLADRGIANPARLRRNAPLAQLLGSYLRASMALTAGADPTVGETAGRHIVELVALGLGASEEAKHAAQMSGLRAARRQLIHDEIEKGFLNPRLTSQAVASAVGVSERYLRSLLEDVGTSFSDLVLHRRLAHAHEMLIEGARSAMRISDIAYDAGFSDLSYFNRAFRRRYGATPRDVRAASMRG